MAVLRGILLIAAIGISIPMLVWTIECAAALLRPRKSRDLRHLIRPAVAVLIPAHNEAGGIRSALESILPQLQPEDRAIVIADNCTDETARIARECGAEVVERNDSEHTGKSYALEYGVRALRRDHRDVFVVFDADCAVDPGTVDDLARLAFATGRPVQAPYLLIPPDASTPQHELAALGLIVKNVARSKGLDRLGLPCFLNGSGMAFPMEAIRNINLANGNLAEDKWMTVDLALSGHLALFSGGRPVRSRLPEHPHAQSSQRTRWIHGHLECMRKQGPRLLWGSIRHRRFALFALALDLFVPPLSLLWMVWLLVMTASVVCGILHNGWLPAVVAGTAAAMMSLTFVGVLLKFSPTGVPGLLAISTYMFFKLPLYVSYLTRREKKWIRTGRDGKPPGS